MNRNVFTPAPRLNDPGVGELLQPPKRISRQRILVAEDDPIICRLVAGVLEEEGFAVDVAFDGEQAWETLLNDHYDLLVTDNDMPQLTGLELIERIRGAGMTMPVIVASGSFSVESVSDHPQLKIAAVLPKPFGRFQLLNTVKSVLPVRRSQPNRSVLERS